MAQSKVQPVLISSNAVVTFEEWSKWKRSLNYYLLAKDITDPVRKQAVLLHKGGRDLQEIFASLEVLHAEAAKKTTDIYKFTVELLDSHFQPTINKFYERHLFHQIRQNDDSIDEFVVKLRKQASCCSYDNVDDAIIEQIIEGASNLDFRRKILEQKLDELPKIIELGKLIESVKIPSDSLNLKTESQTESVPTLRSSALSTHSSKGTDNFEKPKSYSRCGRRNRSSDDESYPARQKRCYRYGQSEHYTNVCWAKSKSVESPTSSSASSKPDKKCDQQKSSPAVPKHRVQAIADDESSSSDSDSIEMADEKNKEVEHINLKVLRQDDAIVNFKMKKQTPMEKLMSAYCRQMGFAMAKTRFRFDGQPINPTDTPSSLEMEEGDTIEVYQEQIG